MRISGLVLCAAASMLATAAFAQSAGGSMSGNSMSGGNAMTMQSGTNIFSRQDMAMMIVDRDKATMGMTDDQKAAARKEEMTKDQAETPDQRRGHEEDYRRHEEALAFAEGGSQEEGGVKALRRCSGDMRLHSRGVDGLGSR